MTTTTEMIESMFTNLGVLFTDFVPLLEFFLGLFIAIYAIGVLWYGIKMLRKIKK